jgi:SAM-dependent methyltransferase
VSFSPTWLALREPADAAARSTALVSALNLSAPLVISDLGCGTGSMMRWLAPQVPQPQRWVLYDRDPALLRHAAAQKPSFVSVETRESDITALTDLADSSLVTCSALLDLLTEEEVDRLARSCVAAGVPALFTLTVAGQVAFDPVDPLDADLAAAFDAHQRRTEAGRRLLGPDAAAAAGAAFERAGATVRVEPSPWRLGLEHASLLAEWLAGWVDAACEQEPRLARAAVAYRRRRVAEIDAGELSVTVGHQDVLAV